jgi:hypothetical protein
MYHDLSLIQLSYKTYLQISKIPYTTNNNFIFPKYIHSESMVEVLVDFQYYLAYMVPYKRYNFHLIDMNSDHLPEKRLLI